MSKQQKGEQTPKVMTRRQKARVDREQQLTYRLLAVVGGVVGVALLAVIAAIIWDKAIVPNQTVAKIGQTEISRSQYQSYREIALAQQIFQVQQQLANYDQFLSQMSPEQQEQFQAQIAQQVQQSQQTQQNAVAELRTLSTASLSYQTIDQMVDEQLIIQGAEAEGVVVTDEQVNQELAAQFAPPSVASTPTPVTSTETLTGTNGVTGTDGVTGTGAVTETTPVTPTATATLVPAEAAQNVQLNLTSYYDQLKAYIQQVSPSTESPFGYDLTFSAEDLIDYVRRQQRVQMLREALGEKLVAEAPTATQVRVQHILISVTVPATVTDQEREAAFIDARREADEVLERLRAGENFEELAKEVSDDTGSAEEGGLYDWASPDTYVPEFKAATLEQPIGEIGEPVRTEYGWHIIKVLGREDRPDESKLETARTEAFDAWLQRQRETIGVQRFPEPTPVPTFPIPPTEPTTGTLELTPTTPVTP